MARRSGPTNIEAAIMEIFRANPGHKMSTMFFQTIIGRDPLSVYRCLLRMKKAGKLQSERIPGSWNTNRWWVA